MYYVRLFNFIPRIKIYFRDTLLTTSLPVVQACKGMHTYDIRTQLIHVYVLVQQIQVNMIRLHHTVPYYNYDCLDDTTHMDGFICVK